MAPTHVRAMSMVVCIVGVFAASLPASYSLPAVLRNSTTVASSAQQQLAQQNKEQATTEETISPPNGANCSVPCTDDEFSIILETIASSSNSADILKRFGQIEQRVDRGRQARATPSPNDRESPSPKVSPLSDSRGNKIRPACLEELINLIKTLAASELEMKTVFEFATSDLVGDKISY